MIFDVVVVVENVELTIFDRERCRRSAEFFGKVGRFVVIWPAVAGDAGRDCVREDGLERRGC